MSLSNFLFGKKPKIDQLPTMNPEQQKLLDQLLSGVGGILPGGLGAIGQMLSGEEAPWEASAKRQFGEEIIPNIAERFSGMGEGAQQSSAFGQQLGAAGAGLAERLGAMRAGERQTGLQSLFNLLGQGLGQRGFQTTIQPGTSGFMQGIAPFLGKGIGTFLGGGLF